MIYFMSKNVKFEAKGGTLVRFFFESTVNLECKKEL